MNLHTNIKLFTNTIRSASQYLEIKQEFVEKDYWITLVLNHLATSKYADLTVFKGGTSLSKGHGLIDRFSEDVDLAIIDAKKRSGNKIKTIIRTVEKETTTALKEIPVEGMTSKGSRFRKSVFEYHTVIPKFDNNKFIVEVNSFANPFPYQKMQIKSMVYDFLMATDNRRYIEQYALQLFYVNVLDKEQTLVEKLVSLIRFSFDEDPVFSISKKIRHFYDLYFLTKDDDCDHFLKLQTFNERFEEILDHDRELFKEPVGWNDKPFISSPLINDFPAIWGKLVKQYKTELSALAYKPIPDQQLIFQSFNHLIDQLK